VELAEEVDAALLQASGLHGSTRGVAVEKHKGSERSMVPRWRAIPAVGRVTCDGAPVKFWHRLGPGSGKEASGSFLGSMRSSGSGFQGLGCSVVVGSRRRRALRGGTGRSGVEAVLGLQL
jgi:hypothetical protein